MSERVELLVSLSPLLLSSDSQLDSRGGLVGGMVATME